MQRVRWAVIGLGRFGTVHARTLGGLPGAELVALCGRRPDVLEQVAGELGVGWTTARYDELLASDRIDAVSITTHWREHLEPARAALAAGKHVLLEKPMACDVGECRELLEAAERSRGFLMVGHVCRFDPRVAVAREAILAGRLGRLISLRSRRNLRRAPGSIRLDKIPPLMGDGIHDADLMLWLLQRLPTRIYARYQRVDDFRYPDAGWAVLEFGGEVTGVIETIWCLPENVPTTIDAKLEIVGTEGMLTIDCSQSGVAILDARGLELPDAAYWPRLHGVQVGALAYELAYFSDCIRRGEPPRVVTPVEAARAVAVMEAAENAARTKQLVDFESPF